MSHIKLCKLEVCNEHPDKEIEHCWDPISPMRVPFHLIRCHNVKLGNSIL